MSLLYSFNYLPNLSLEDLLSSTHIFTNNFPEIQKLNVTELTLYKGRQKKKRNKTNKQKKNPKQSNYLSVNKKLRCKICPIIVCQSSNGD